MIQAPGGVLVKSPTTSWEGDTRTFQGFSSLAIGNRYASYSQLYREQLWVATVVNKLAYGTARLPLKVYQRDELNRPEAAESPYARLLARPSRRHAPKFFWLWVSSTYDVYGETFLGKIRDPGGRPIELVMLHPTAMHPEDVGAGEEQTWTFRNGTVEIKGIRQSDLVHFKTYNPDSTLRGMSKLEPLRRTLEFEDAAQRAQSAFWRKGARPGVALSHPGQLTQEAADRLKVRWDAIASGADNTGTTVVLEEGMKPEVLTVSNGEAQYIESRKLNREEVCAVYDIPPAAVHILDRATFSNITENLRSVYRDSQAPRLNMFESVLENDLRASVRPGATSPDFGGDVYAEFLLDEVLRGDFEKRAEAYKNADYMTMAEKRRRENLPFIEGTDRIYVNAAIVPLDAAAYTSASTLTRAGYDAGEVLDALALPPIAHDPTNAQASASGATAMRSVMGRLSRVTDLADIDPVSLSVGVEDLEPTITATLTRSIEAGETVPQFRDRLKALAGG